MYYVACPNSSCPQQWLRVDPADLRRAQQKHSLRVRCRRCRTSFLLLPEAVLEAPKHANKSKRPLWNKVVDLFSATMEVAEDGEGSDVARIGEDATSAVAPTNEAPAQQTRDCLQEVPESSIAADMPKEIVNIPDVLAPSPPNGDRPRVGDEPDRIGRFEIVGKLGEGSFGTVYRAIDPHLKRPVALKIPRRGTLETPRRLKRLLEEAQTAAQLRHPHIVPIFEVGSDNNRPYIAFAFIDGQTLAQAIDERRIKLRRAAVIVRDLAEALDYAHSLGIVHRDVKPSNVLLDSADRCQLVDFGLACRYDPASEENGGGPQEATRGISGTPAFMAPEHWSGCPVPSSDQYSLGVVLYELICGSLPFEGPQSVLKYNHEKCQPDSPRGRNPSLPRDLESICLKALAKHPKDRYANCQELADDLRRWLEGEAIKARRMGAGERLLRWCLKEPALAGTLGFALTILLTFGLAMFLYARAMERQRNATVRAIGIANINAEKRDQEAKRADDKSIEAMKNAAKAQENERSAQRNLAGSQIDRALILCERGEVGQGLVRLADARRLALQSNAADLVRVIDFNLSAWRRQLYALTALLPHPHPVTASVYDRDNRMVATASGQSVHFWVAASGKPLPQTLIHPEPVIALGFGGSKSPYLLVAGSRKVRVWNLSEPAQPPAQYDRDKDAPIRTACISPDGKTVLLAGGTEGRQDGWALLWTPEEKKEVSLPLQKPSDVVHVAVFSPDGSQCATGSGSRFSGEARLWDARTGQPLGPALKHDRTVSAAAFSPDGTLLLTGTRGLFEGEAQLWDVAGGERKGAPLLTALEILAVAFSPDGLQAAIGGQDRAVRLWDLKKPQPTPIGSPMRHAMDVNSIAFSPDARSLLTGSADGTARLWQISTEVVPAVSCGHLGPVLAVAPNPQRRLLCTGSAHLGLSREGLLGLSGQVRLLHPKTGRALGQVSHPMPVSALAWHPNGDLLLTGCWDGRVRLWDLSRGLFREPIVVFEPDPKDEWVQALAFSPDGKRFAAAWRNGTVRMMEISADGRRELWRIKAHEERLYALAFSPDGQRIATGSHDRTIRFWDATTGKAIPDTTMTHPDAVLSLVYSSDGRYLLSGYAGGARLWDVESGRSIRAPLQHQAGVFGVSFGPGKRILTSGTDRIARLWDLETGKPLGPAFYHEGAILAAAFDDWGTTAITAGLDAYCRLWPVPAPIVGNQEQLARWAEVISGIELGADDTIGMLSPADWANRRQLLEKAGGFPAIEDVLQREVAARPVPVLPKPVPNPHALRQAAGDPPPERRPADRTAHNISVFGLMEIDVSRLFNAPIAQAQINDFRKKQLEPFLETHPLLEMMKPMLPRIQRITALVRGTIEKPEILLFFRGDLDAPALRGALELYHKENHKELRVEKDDDGRTIYIHPLAEWEASAAFRDDRTFVVASSRQILRDALDAGEAGATLEWKNVTLPRHRLERREALWLAILFTDQMKANINRLGGVLEKVSPGLRAASATIDVQKQGVGLDLRIHTDGRKIAGQVKEFLADAVQASDQLARFFPRITVEEGDVVHVRFFLNEAALKQFLPASK